MTTRAQQVLSTAGCAVFLTVFLTLSTGVVIAETVTDANVAKLTATAKTAADHEAIAAYYQQEAKEALERVKLHENMLRTTGPAAPGKQLFNSMKPHCERLIKAYQEAAEDYEALAELQLKLAKEAQK